MNALPTFLLGILLSGVAVGFAGAAQAQSSEPTGTSSAPLSVTSSVDAFRGLYSESAPITVPSFHGIEPQLAISYTATESAGFAGVGWSLAGASVIERASAGKGAPRYDANDIFLLDGQPLVPCAAGSTSPSCAAGGTHSTKIETYSRIKYDATANTWTIWQKNGTQSVYAPSYVVSAPVTTCGPTNPTVSGAFAPYCDGGGCYSDLLGFSAAGTTINFLVNRMGFDGSSAGTAIVPGLALGGGASVAGEYSGAGVFYISTTSSNVLHFSALANAGDMVFQGATVSGYYQDQLAGSPDVQTVTASGHTITFSDGSATGTVTLSPGIACTTTMAPVAFRYGLTTVKDTSSNTVSYNWSCDPGADCYLDNVAYNRTTVKLYRESRPDPISFANGAYVGRTNYRLKSVDVLVQDVDDVVKRTRAYKLAYDSSPDSGRSRLLSVQVFGRDANVDATGTVSGGTALPAATFGYSSAPLGATDAAAATFSAAIGTGVPTYSLGDFNGDGKTDFCYREGNGRTVHVVGSNGAALGDHVWGTMSSDPSSGPFEGGFGDFNGDGKLDFLYRASNTRDMHVLLANATGTAFTADAVWLTKAADPGASLVEECVADFNGDGRADYLYRQSNTNTYRVLLSTGSGFASDSVWGVAAAAAANNPFEGGCADFDGDGKADYLYRATGTQVLHVLRSTGTAFQADAVWGTKALASGTGPYEGGIVDLNGDGKADYAYRASNTQTMHVLLSQGNGFVADAVWGQKSQPSGTGPYEGGFADVNGDGRLDYVYRASNSSQMNVLLSTGIAFQAERPWAVHTVGASSSPVDTPLGGFADVNGDGRSDYVYMAGNVAHLVSNAAPVGDLLTSAANGYGGTVSLGYTPSSAFANTNAIPVVQTLTSETTNDGRGNTATATFSYSGGLWDPLDRQFLGFRYSKSVSPCITGETACPYSETWFKQDYGSVSKPERVDRRDGAGNLLVSDQYQYTTNGSTVPYQSLDTGHWVYAYDSAGGMRRTFVARSYDNLGFNGGNPVWGTGYGNVVQEVIYGDYDVSGDEKTVRYVYVPNASAYIVGKPALVDTFAGTTTGGALLAETLNYYDGQSTWNAPPLACGAPPCGGKVTKALAWLNTTNSYVSTTTAYDAYGNVTVATDRVGNSTTSEYDAKFHAFPTKRTNPLNQSGTADWDPVCEHKTREVDANQLVTTYQSDALCRTSRTDAPGGNFVTIAHVNTGDPNNQYVETQTPAADATGNVWTRTYEDGLGRAWRVVTKGAQAGQETYSETTFTARGSKASVTAPHFAGSPTATTTMSYDALDRVVSVTHPDNSSATRAYFVDHTVATDELGHSLTDYTDASGHVTRRQEMLAGVPRSTTYVYDARGYLTSISDAASPPNVSASSTDSLGRRIQFVDPDAGLTTFTYDADDRLTSQQNPVTVMQFTYDALGRKTTRQTQARLGGPAQTVSWTYDEPRAGYLNIGHLTTMTDGSGQESYNYDAGGRPIEWTRTIDGAVYEFQAGFDAAGRLQWTRYPDGDFVGTPAAPLTYDGAGRVRAIPGFVSNTLYDAAGQTTVIANGNGTTTTLGYSPTRSWLTSISVSRGPQMIESLDYSQTDVEGKHIAVFGQATGETWLYQYDEMHRLTSATMNFGTDPAETQTFDYDAIGNIVANSRVGSYVYDRSGGAGPHAVTQAGSSRYTYDAAGNMTSGGGRTIQWDPIGKPASVNQVSFAYDGNGARIKKVDGGATTLYLGDSVEVTGGVFTKYVSLGGRLIAKRVGQTPYWLHVDHQNSVRVITDAGGIEVQRQQYRPYGEQISSSNPTAESLGYTGQRQDETGLVYLHARYYDPQLGRFVSADPTIPSPVSVGLNRYAYAANNPIDHTDVDGLGGFDIFKNVFSIASTVLDVAVPGAGEFVRIASYVMSAATAANAGARGGWAAFAHAAAGEAISQVSSELTSGLGDGFSRKGQIALQSSIAFGTGFASSLASGASPGQALKGASIGALESTATSLGEAAIDYFRYSVVLNDATPDGGKKRFSETTIIKGIQQTPVDDHHTVLLDPSITYADTGRVTYFQAVGIAKKSASSLPGSNGHFFAFVHGDQQRVDVPVLINGHVREIPISAHTFTRFMRMRTAWHKGEAINLISCETGKGANPFALQVARALHIYVWAYDHPITGIESYTFLDDSIPFNGTGHKFK